MTALQGFLRWVRRNLFATPADALITLVCVSASLWALASMARWAVEVAQWSSVVDNLRVFMVGTFPADLMDRAWASAALLALLGGMSLGAVAGPMPRLTVPFAVGFGVLALAANAMSASAAALSFGFLASALLGWLAGGKLALLRKLLPLAWAAGVVAIAVALAPSGMERWGGLLMSVVFTLLASVLSVPLGIALALGRRSKHPSARILCSAYIETMRSLPLILVVYCIWIMLPLLAPASAGPDLARGLLGFTLFFAAYVAEYVRSGLQGIPRGQVEAAQSLGMSPLRINTDIVLPQAIRVVMPALVGNVLDIFNTVPLLFIIGVTDFLRAGQMVLVNPKYGANTYEIYVFMFAVYLAMASLITFGARRLEERMAAGR